MSRKTLVVVVVIIAIGIGYFLLQSQESGDKTKGYIGESIAIISYKNDGESNGVASVTVPYKQAVTEDYFVSAGVDLDGNGTYSSDEWVVKNVPVQNRANWSYVYYFSVDSELTGTKSVKVVYNATVVSDDTLTTGATGVLETKTASLAVSTYDATSLLDFSTITNSDEAMKGVGIPVAQAEEVSIITGGVPDIPQKPGECAPTAATNSLTSLIDKNKDDNGNGGGPDPNETIDELKGDMGWTKENGVLPDNFVTGKNAWANRHGYPINTEKKGDANGINAADEIRDALQNGKAVDLRLKFGNAAGQAVGGHMVTVTGFHTNGSQTYIDVNDPASPEGTDTYEIQGNQLTNYGYWNGPVQLGWVFTQTWTGASTETAMDVPAGDINPLVSLDINALDFTYDHSNPICPLPIGELVLDVPPGASWAVDYGPGGPPIWISFPNGDSGQGSTTIPVEFPCQLDDYVDQTQSASLQINVSDGNDNLIGSESFEVNGTFENF